MVRPSGLEPTERLGYHSRMAAQNQHYVPKFILREFLSNDAKERVNVYDKQADRTFVTSIRNIMAERRFNEFAIDEDHFASFEPVACGAEDRLLPVYREVVEQRRLDDTPEQKAALSVFLAFQILRTKSHRDLWMVMEEETVRMIEASGGSMQDLRGWEDWQPATEESLKRDHLMSIQGHLGELARVISTKDFVLIEPAPGTSFHIGDNPVVRANSRDFGPCGNLGFAQEGIEIYMPLAADLLLCAWCPSLLREIRDGLENAKRVYRVEGLRQVGRREIDAEHMRDRLEALGSLIRPLEDLVRLAAAGRPSGAVPANMDYYNSLQFSWAQRYVISRDGGFELARRLSRKGPGLRHHRRPRTV